MVSAPSTGRPSRTRLVTIPGSDLGASSPEWPVTSHSQFGTGTAVFNDFSLSTADVHPANPRGRIRTWAARPRRDRLPCERRLHRQRRRGNDIWGTNRPVQLRVAEPDRERHHHRPGHRPVQHRSLGQVGDHDQAVHRHRLRLRAARRHTRQRHHVPVRLQHQWSSGSSYTFPNAWLRLTRSGATITAYSSPDGTTWTQVGTATIAMTDPGHRSDSSCARTPPTTSTHPPSTTSASRRGVEPAGAVGGF